jgi:hypothetical protein
MHAMCNAPEEDCCVVPPHKVDDLALFRRLLRALDDGEALPPVVVVRCHRHLQGITGSHRLAAWEHFEKETGQNLRRLIVIELPELRQMLVSARLPDDFHEARKAVPRMGELVFRLHNQTERADLRAALEGQW